MKHLTEQDYQISSWSGGKTIQIAIAPEGAVYADRDFLWRLSSATVDLEESDFTALPDYVRLIAPVHGQMELTHNGGTPVNLMPYEVHRFDGADATHSRGQCTDFNLMLRKGACGGRLSPLGDGSSREEILTPEPGTEVLVIYCTEGHVSVMYKGEHMVLAGREAAMLQGRLTGPVTLMFSEGGRAMCAQAWHLPGASQ